jgi:hypothetical protein
MRTSPAMLLKSVSCLEDEPIDPAMLGYFHALSQDEAHGAILGLFRSLAEEGQVTRAFIARRLNKSPEQVTRWLSAPGNWTLDTFTNLALAMGHKPTLGTEAIRGLRQANEHHPAVSRIKRDKTGPRETSPPAATEGSASLGKLVLV